MGSLPSPPSVEFLGFAVYDFGPFFGLLKGPTGGYIIMISLFCFIIVPALRLILGWVAGRILMESRGSKNRIWQGVVP